MIYRDPNEPRSYRGVRDQLLILALGTIGAVAALFGAILLLAC